VKDQLEHRLSVLEVEMGFCMRYCRAAALALGAMADVKAIDTEREEWLAAGPTEPPPAFRDDEETDPSVRKLDG
jgi:hypothetical protein